MILTKVVKMMTSLLQSFNLPWSPSHSITLERLSSVFCQFPRGFWFLRGSGNDRRGGSPSLIREDWSHLFLDWPRKITFIYVITECPISEETLKRRRICFKPEAGRTDFFTATLCSPFGWEADSILMAWTDTAVIKVHTGRTALPDFFFLLLKGARKIWTHVHMAANWHAEPFTLPLSSPYLNLQWTEPSSHAQRTHVSGQKMDPWWWETPLNSHWKTEHF